MSNNGLIVHNDSVAIFDTAKFEHMFRVAKVMAATTLVPEHLQKQEANCMMVCQQADRWEMDPFAVAQCTFVTKGKLGYEGKLIAAVINARAKLKGRLKYDISGAGHAMKIIVSGTFRDEEDIRSIEATWAEGRKMSQGGAKWEELPDQMLCYYGARKWGRRHAPELMLGILAEEELGLAQPQGMKDITPEIKPKSLDDLVTAAAAKSDPARPETANGHTAPDADEIVDFDPDTGEITETATNPGPDAGQLQVWLAERELVNVISHKSAYGTISDAMDKATPELKRLIFQRNEKVISDMNVSAQQKLRAKLS